MEEISVEPLMDLFRRLLLRIVGIKRNKIDGGYDIKTYVYKYFNLAVNVVPIVQFARKASKENAWLVGDIRRSQINSSILDEQPAEISTYE